MGSPTAAASDNGVPRPFDEILNATPHATQSPYRLGSTPNVPIPLFRGRIEIDLGEGVATTQGAIHLRWLPKPRVAFAAILQAAEAGLNNDQWTGTLAIPRRRARAACRLSGKQLGSSVSVKGFLTRPFTIGAGEDLASVVFHLANFRNYLGSPVRSGTKWFRGRLHLEGGGWSVDIDAMEDLERRVRTLRGDGGYSVTHLGRLTRSDNSAFSADDAASVLDALGNLLSLARGTWSDPFLPLGYDKSGRLVWRKWAEPRIEQWRPSLSWFQDDDPESLARAFPELVRLWADPDWRTTLGRAVYTYVGGNMGSSDIGLVIAQANLELLARAVLVQKLHRSAPTHAAEGMRRLVAWSRTSPQVPRALKALRSLTVAGVGQDHQDGPTKVAWVRNHFAHAKATGPSSAHYIEAWRLALWYQDLVLLRILRCYGPYRSRADDSVRTIARK
jgi:hypothetical protein